MALNYIGNLGTHTMTKDDVLLDYLDTIDGTALWDNYATNSVAAWGLFRPIWTQNAMNLEIFDVTGFYYAAIPPITNSPDFYNGSALFKFALSYSGSFDRSGGTCVIQYSTDLGSNWNNLYSVLHGAGVFTVGTILGTEIAMPLYPITGFTYDPMWFRIRWQVVNARTNIALDYFNLYYKPIVDWNLDGG